MFTKLSRSSLLSRLSTDVFTRFSLRFAAFLSGALVLTILVFLFFESREFFLSSGGWGSLNSTDWYPLEGLYGLGAMVLATASSAFGSLIVTFPLGFLFAVFLNFYSKGWSQKFFKGLLELYSGVPSVVVGLWGLVVLVPLVNQWRPPGASLFSAIVILSIMTLPTVVLVIDSAIRLVPRSRQLASDSLGISRESFIFRVVVPEIRPSLVTSVILQLGRALGETMAVMMVCGNIPQVPQSLFDPVRTLTANMALEMAYAIDLHRSSLFFTGFVLTLFTGFLVLIAMICFKKERKICSSRGVVIFFHC